MACQWNGRYRDDLRRFVKGDPGNESPLQSLHYRVPARAVVVLVRVSA